MNVASKSKLITDLRLRAQKLGFAQFGIAAAQTPNIWHDRLNEAVQKGWHGDMDWMAQTIDRRVAPTAP